MTESLWHLSAAQLLAKTASTDPTPGGGAIAALTAAFGLALIEMAIRISLLGSGGDPGADGIWGRLRAAHDEAANLAARLNPALDGDVSEFVALMNAYQLPRESGPAAAARRVAITSATVTATQGPLDLAEAATAAIRLADRVEPMVKASIVSDVQAGRDLLSGARLAALRTAGINMVTLEGRPESALLSERYVALLKASSSGGGSDDANRTTTGARSR